MSPIARAGDYRKAKPPSRGMEKQAKPGAKDQQHMPGKPAGAAKR